MNMHRRGLWGLLLTGFLFLGAQPAQAYLDPGTGSMILQAVIGAVAGALIVIKLYWYRLVTFFKGDAAARTDVHKTGARGTNESGSKDDR